MANSRVVKSEVDVTAGFDDTATTIDVQVAAVSFQGTAESDASAVDIYQCNGGVENAAAAVVTAVAVYEELIVPLLETVLTPH